jgi:hypothetical protein
MTRGKGCYPIYGDNVVREKADEKWFEDQVSLRRVNDRQFLIWGVCILLHV